MAAANPPGFPQPRMYTPQVATPVQAPLQAPQQMASPTKDVNTAALCRVGQEFVQEIVQKTAEVFGILKTIQVYIWINIWVLNICSGNAFSII